MARTELFLACGLALAAGLTITGPALAALPRAHGSNGGFEAAPGIAKLRANVRARYDAAPTSRRPAWAQFTSDAGGAWSALWDLDTGTPLRIYGSGIPAPGANASAPVAEAAARLLLERHLPLLAPGARLSELVLVADVVEDGMRTVAFEQRLELPNQPAARVVGGSVSFRFKNDRVIVIASEATGVTRLAPRIDAGAAEAAALAWIADSHAGVALADPAELVAVPLGADRAGAPAVDGGALARLAYRVGITAAAPVARYDVYVDARSGAPLARDGRLRFAEATARFDVPVRSPLGERRPYAPSLLFVTVDGAAETTDVDGSLAWPTPGAATLEIGVKGSLVHVHNVAGAEAQVTFDVNDASEVVWSLADDELGDAQLTSFIHVGLAKKRARIIAPGMTFLDAPLFVNDNKSDDQGCNAYWDGTSLNFLRENGLCNNSGRIADVVYHEFGHAFHQHAMIVGVAEYESALTEGAGDYFAVTMTGDPVLGPGFFTSGAYIREVETDRRWPDDIDPDPHMTGLIFAGAMWDLRKALFDELGREGVRIADGIYYGVLRHASSIPTTYVDALAADDDDGDLSNGTPHVCALNLAFSRHGLAPVLTAAGVTLVHDPLTVIPLKVPQFVRATAHALYPQCSGAAGLDDVRIEVHALGGDPETIHLAPEGDDWIGELPGQPNDGPVFYKLVAKAGDVEVRWPDNPADPEYVVYAGDVRPLYCTDFEHGAEGWVAGDDDGGSGAFARGTPAGNADDPDHAFSGANVFGTALGQSDDGRYRPRRTAYLDAPPIDVGDEQHVRLQFRRWLTVQDGYYDQASIYANGAWVWQNAATDENGFIDHLDREWRFADADVSSAAASGTVQIRFELAADATIQLGGWNIDDVCLVAWTPTDTPSAPVADAEAPPAEPSLDPSGGCSLANGRRSASSDAAALVALVALALAGHARRVKERRRLGRSCSRCSRLCCRSRRCTPTRSC